MKQLTHIAITTLSLSLIVACGSQRRTGAPGADGVSAPKTQPEVAQSEAKERHQLDDSVDAEESQATAEGAPQMEPPATPLMKPPKAEAVAPSMAKSGAQAPHRRARLNRAAPRGLKKKLSVDARSRAPLVMDSPRETIAPGREHNTEQYDSIIENRFLSTNTKPLSTFSIDVDTASYSNARRFLSVGQAPPKGAIRIEELVNYFDYQYPQPTGEAPFSVTTEVSSAPWKPEHRLVHIGLQGKELAPSAIPGRNLVFLLDVSGSMSNANKLPLLKRSFSALLQTLNARDRVAIVVYAGASGLVLPSTPASNRRAILGALDRLSAGGSTNGASGIQLAYDVARAHRTKGGVNRVILATDGDFNVGTTSRSDLMDLIEQERTSGVFLTVLGFGMGNYKDATLEQLADKGNGNYAYIDSFREARKVLVQEANSTLITIAKDVKIQVEFNPTVVGAYRLIGYENRKLRDEDFNDDTKDAGEIGAGHTVTALYEVVSPAQAQKLASVDRLKYQRPKPADASANRREIMTVKLRYKSPRGNKSRLIRVPIKNSSRELAQTSDNFRFSAGVAAFGMLLRGSEHKGNASFSMAERLAKGALGADRFGYRHEFLSLINDASRLGRTQALAR